jgi:hypothetical protein
MARMASTRGSEFLQAVACKKAASTMKLQINSWNAVSTWTWNANDDTCGICRQAFDGFVIPANVLLQYMLSHCNMSCLVHMPLLTSSLLQMLSGL